MRLIDADELLKGKEDHQMISTHLVWNAPTVDAVPVVRCEQCKWWGEVGKPDGRRCCYLLGIRLEPEFWCAYGERKEE